MTDRAKLIKSFKTTQELDEEVATELINEFQKPGLILLPVGKTFESSIYPIVNKYFAYEEYKVIDTENQDTRYNSKHKQVHSQLWLSHLDELVNDKKTSFSTKLISSLPSVVDQLQERFYVIDIDDMTRYDLFIKRGGGPRIIVLGLGADPEIAHVAFIGEEFINTTTAKVELSDPLKDSQGAKFALTIGTDIFRSSNLERIIVVVKGASKAESLAQAFSNPDTGLGYLINNHLDKLIIYADDSALQG
jgi:6-phosphogluconolactonase/glucosamine-6-phosphate isomerase/deaminase